VSSQAATFVDYGNLYSVLAAQTDETHPPKAFATEILNEVRRYLAEGDDTPTVLGRAYADFNAIPDVDGAALLHELDREHLEPVFASTEVQGNTAELRLCMDVIDTLDAYPNLNTIVIVTGDRPYLPLARRIRERGCRALVAIVNPPRSQDGLPQSDADVYLDARNLLSRSSREALLQNASRSSNGASSQASEHSAAQPLYRPLTSSIARRTVEITEEYFGQYDEVYLTPLLRKLSDVLGDAHDPKALVSELEAAGAVRLEKREGYPYDYTVLIVNDEHPSVQEIHDDYYTGRSPFTYEEIAGSTSSERSAADDSEGAETPRGPADTPDAADNDPSASDTPASDSPASDSLEPDDTAAPSADPDDEEPGASYDNRPYTDRAPSEAPGTDDASDSSVTDDSPSDVDAPSP
jgi:hypothetical protein